MRKLQVYPWAAVHRLLAGCLLICGQLVTGHLSNGQHGAPRDADSPERGDVPGWVLVTLMTALIVAALLAIALPTLTGLLQKALSQVN